MSFDTREIYANTSEYIRASQQIPAIYKSDIQDAFTYRCAKGQLVRQRNGNWQLFFDGEIWACGTLNKCISEYKQFNGIV